MAANMSYKRSKKRKAEETLEVPKPKACDRCKAVHKKCKVTDWRSNCNTD